MPRWPGEVGFILITAMMYSACLGSLPRKVQLLTFLQRHVGLANMVAAAHRAAEALGLALDVDDGHAGHFNLEHEFDGRLDLGLGCILQHLEGDGVALLGDGGGLFGHDRRDEDLHQPAFFELALRGSRIDAAHANISLSWSMAPLVTSAF